MKASVLQSEQSPSSLRSQLKEILLQASPWILLTAGILIRLWQYLQNRALWHDEAKLALNIMDKNFFELLFPLDYHQGAPILFLLLEKVSITLFGPSELALRLLPLLSSFLGLVIFYKLAKHLFDWKFVLAALFLFVFSYKLVYYGQEVKQYSFDVTVSLALVYMLVRFRPLKRPSLKVFFLFSVVGGVALWLSHASLFILPGVGIVLATNCFKERSTKCFLGLGVVIAFWLLNFAALYFIQLKSLMSNEVMLNFWQRGFLPPPTNLQNIGIVYRRLVQFVTYSGFHRSWLSLVTPLFLIGSINIFLNKKSESFLVLLPFCLTLFAAALHTYSFSNRLILFLVPFFYIVIVHGLSVLTRNRKPYVVIILIFLTLLPFIRTGYTFTAPITREEIKPLLAHLDVHRKKDEKVYVSSGAWHPVRYYQRLLNIDCEDWIRGTSPMRNLSRWKDEMAGVSANPRVWFLFSHIPHDEKAFFLSNIPGNGVEEIHAEGASLYVYRFE